MKQGNPGAEPEDIAAEKPEGGQESKKRRQKREKPAETETDRKAPGTRYISPVSVFCFFI